MVRVLNSATGTHDLIASYIPPSGKTALASIPMYHAEEFPGFYVAVTTLEQLHETQTPALKRAGILTSQESQDVLVTLIPNVREFFHTHGYLFTASFIRENRLRSDKPIFAYARLAQGTVPADLTYTGVRGLFVPLPTIILRPEPL